MKVLIDPIPNLFPHPIVLVTCIDSEGKDNIITIGAITLLSKIPVLFGIAIRKGKYSGILIKDSKEFVINVPGKRLIKEIDICGTTHGKILNKFRLTNLSKTKSSIIKPCLINKCPINIECKVINIIETGEDDFFIGEAVKVHIEEKILQGKRNIDFSRLNPVIYCNQNYYKLGRFINSYGFSKKIKLLN